MIVRNGHVAKHIYEGIGNGATRKITLVKNGNLVTYPATPSTGTGCFCWPNESGDVYGSGSGNFINLNNTIAPDVAGHTYYTVKADATVKYHNEPTNIGTWISLNGYRCLRVPPQTVDRAVVIKSSFDANAYNNLGFSSGLIIVRRNVSTGAIINGGSLFRMAGTTGLVANKWNGVWQEFNITEITSTIPNINHDIIPFVFSSSSGNIGPREIRGIACSISIY